MEGILQEQTARGHLVRARLMIARDRHCTIRAFHVTSAACMNGTRHYEEKLDHGARVHRADRINNLRDKGTTVSVVK